MTIKEFSEGFDAMIASYAISQKIAQEFFSFDEYEKSIFLTKAQEEIVKSLYTDFEKTETVRRQLSTLIKEKSNLLTCIKKEDSYYHSTVPLEDDTWFIIYEQVISNVSDTKCESSLLMDVYPITHDEYHKIRKNPFKGPNKRRVLRLDEGKNVELIGVLALSKYIVRYLSKPSPIILVDLTDTSLKINEQNTAMTCSLSSSIHQEILSRAVQLAIASRNIMNNNNQ